MRNYCTLFDGGAYLAQGLALYESLVKHSSGPFRLYALPMDMECDNALSALALPHLEIVRYMVLGEVNGPRSKAEFCWMMASQLCEFLMYSGADEITYLDADTFILSDPEVVFAEIGDKSIGITPHRLIPSKRHLEVNGKFNVGWVTFRNDASGWDCAKTWAKQCRDRCSAEVGCGDQQYLDDWPLKYRGACHIIQNIGVNAAPWNIGNWEVTQGPKVGGVPIVLFHAHEYRHGECLTNYELRDCDRKFIYKPYAAAVEAAKARIAAVQVSA